MHGRLFFRNLDIACRELRIGRIMHGMNVILYFRSACMQFSAPDVERRSIRLHTGSMASGGGHHVHMSRMYIVCISRTVFVRTHAMTYIASPLQRYYGTWSWMSHYWIPQNTLTDL
jgi:hypothetical protein